MPTHCYIPILGKRLRVTTLDECGRPLSSGTADAFLVTDGFITATLSSEVEDGAEIITKKADGSLCVNEKLADSFKRFTVEIEFCGVNPSLLSIVSNAKAYKDTAGDVAGFTVPEGTIAKQFAMELWTGLSGAACVPGQDTAGGYLLLPFVKAGVLGDIAVDGENAVTFSLTGAYTRGGNGWGVGPFKVLLGGGAAVNEVQTVTITGTPSGGTFTLTYSGQTTTPIAYNAANTVVKTALEALSNIGVGDVAVTGGPGPATPYVVTFQGALAGGDRPQMTGSGALLTPSGTVTVTTTTPGQPSAQVLPLAVDPMEHLLLMDTGLGAPPSACSPQAMP